MPADLLEKPAEIEESASKLPRLNLVRPNIWQNDQPAPETQPAATWWQKIFKGHEEYLGWTPE